MDVGELRHQHEEITLTARALARGADGFFGLSIGEAELLGAVRSVRDGLLEDDESVQAATGGTADGLLGSDVGLTPRETEVLTLLVRGYRNKRIAKELGVEEVTVKVHLYHLFQKLGVSSRAEAIVTSLRMGF